MENVNTSLTFNAPPIATPTQPNADLWNEAVRKLDEADKQRIDFQRADRRLVLDELLKVVGESKKVCDDRRWKFKKQNGETIVIRESLDRVVEWIRRFREVGDVIAQYDPAHASLPWAGIRMILQIAINHNETYGAVVEGIELISRLVARYAKVECLYLHDYSDDLGLRKCITELYVAILTYLLRVRGYFARTTAGRLTKALVQGSSGFDKYLNVVAQKAKEVDEIARLIDADFVRKMARFTYGGLQELNQQISGLKQKLEDFRLNSMMISASPSASLEQLLAWLDPTFTDEEYEIARDSRTTGTCQWILQHDSFLSWASVTDQADMRMLWIHGPAGCGKTFLSAKIVQYLRERFSDRVAYFFCVSDDEAKHRPHAIIRSWVAQIMRQHGEALEIVREFYQGKEGRAATTSDVWHLLKTISRQILGFFFVVDGFDECDLSSNSGGVDFLQSLVRFSDDISGNVLVVSREVSTIGFQLKSLRNLTHVKFFEHKISIADTKDDIKAFASQVIEESLPNKNSSLKDDITNKASERCDGMFLWIRLLSRHMTPGKNAKKLHEVVDKTPSGLEKTYERDLARIAGLGEETARALAILRWTLFAIRPLTVRELTEALMVDDIGCETYPKDDLPDTWNEEEVNDEIRRICGSLIELRKGPEQQSPQEQTVHFVHFSVREYLRTSIMSSSPHGFTRLGQAPAEHDFLTRICLQYLSYNEVTATTWPDTEALQQLVGQYGFLRYASRFWYVHARRAEKWSSRLVDLVKWYFEPDALKWCIWPRVLEQEGIDVDKDLDSGTTGVSVHPLYYVCWLGFIQPFRYLQSHICQGQQVFNDSMLFAAARNGNLEIVEALIKQRMNVNAVKKHGWTPLLLAAHNGHSEVVKTLIRSGAEVNAECDDRATSLFLSAKNGHNQVARILIDSQANVNAVHNNGATPLHVAALNGHNQVVQSLIDHGADLKLTANEGGTPLHAAAHSRDLTTVKTLIENGANLNAARKDGIVPLHFAAIRDCHEVAQYLISHHAEVNVVDESGATPLYYAANLGHTEMAQRLLDHGAELEKRTKDGGTALYVAAAHRQYRTVQMLLDHGAEVNVQCEMGASPLYQAALNDDIETMKILIDHKALPNSRAENGETPLHIAALEGHDQVLQHLIQHGGDVTAETEVGSTPLLYAVVMNRWQTAILLLDYGAEVNSRNQMGFTFLHSSAHNGYPELMNVLIDRGADVNVRQNDGFTPLHYAAMVNRLEVVRLLIDRNAKVNAKSKTGDTPLHIAAHKGFFEIAKILVDSHADVNATGSRGYTPLHQAILGNNVKAIKSLIKNKVYVSAKGEDGGSPLHIAVSAGHIDTIRVLIDANAIIDTADHTGWTPLEYAAWIGHLQIMEMLIDKGGKVERDGEKASSVFLKVAYDGNLEVVRFLVHHIDVNVSDDKGTTALHLAAHCGHAEVVKALTETPSPIINTQESRGRTTLHLSPRDWFHRTPCHLAISMGHIEVAKMLIENGADVHTVSGYGRSIADEVLANQSLKTFLGELVPSHVTTSDEDHRSTLRRSIHQISERLLTNKDQETSEFDKLGHCFLFLKQFDDANRAFQQLVLKLNDEGLPVHKINCSFCQIDSDIIGPRFVCTTCTAVDLCSKCMQDYSDGQEMGMCQTHEFYEVDVANSLVGDAKSAYGLPESVQEWLSELIERYDDRR